MSHPWESEPTVHDWSCNGFRCHLRRNAIGVWCGYVEVPAGHPWYGRDYGDLESASVHGGLTFAGARDFEGKDWWVGFDCGHAGDGIPGLVGMPIHMGEYRTFEYAHYQTEHLAKQAKEALS